MIKEKKTYIYIDIVFVTFF